MNAFFSPEEMGVKPFIGGAWPSAFSPDEMIVDNFAGGGGASTGIEAALGRPIDVAINHDERAIAMHRANHPDTVHLCQNVWQADPFEVVRHPDTGKPREVGLAWFSPDCKHFSKAKGAAPVARNIRDLAWVVVEWASRVRPRVIMLENVEEFRTWGPIDNDGKIVGHRKGETFDIWVKSLRLLGYKVEWRELRACDYGAPTIRKRLFLIARCDGQPIVWPKPTHSAGGDNGLSPFRTAADCIDFSIAAPSIFEREQNGKKPLADTTCRRIATGIHRYVIDAARPFIVPVTHQGSVRVHSIDDPLRTITTANRGELMLAVPTLVGAGGAEYAGKPRSLEKPLNTVTAHNRQALITAFLAQHNTMPRGGVHPGRGMDQPISTIVGRGTQQNLVTSHLIKFRGTCADGQPVTEPMPTICASGTHVGEIRAFLIKYYGNESGAHSVENPLGTVTTKERFGLVTVNIDGEPWVLTDIGMRMLTARELFRAQSFNDNYIINPDFEGKPLTKTAQVACCGNSVPPVMAEMLVRANLMGGAQTQFVEAAE